ncbi:unnamed protein product [Caenorhabditis brenneri]
MDTPLLTIVEVPELFTPSVPQRMLTRSITHSNSGAPVSTTPLTSNKLNESGSMVAEETTNKRAGRSRKTEIQSQEDSKKARLVESSHPLVNSSSIGSLEPQLSDMDLIRHDMKLLHEQSASIIRILETSVIEKLDIQVVKGDIKPLVVSMDNFRSDLTQADLTERTALEAVTASLKKTVMNLQTIQDRYSAQEERWSYANQKLAEQSKQLVEHYESIFKMSTELTQQSKSLVNIRDGLARITCMLNPVQPGPVSQPLVPSKVSKPKKAKGIKRCVFCSRTKHPSMQCDVFRDYAAKAARAIEINICKKCCSVFAPNGFGIHIGCRSKDIQCRRCSHLFDDKHISNHNKIFCSLITRSQPVHRQNHRFGRGRGRPITGQFNRNFH